MVCTLSMRLISLISVALIVLTSQVSSQQYTAIPECEVLTEFKPIPANKQGLRLNWDQKAQPLNKMWVKAFKEFKSVEESGFTDINVITTMTMVPSTEKMSPWALHLRVELKPKKGKPDLTEWPHLAVNFINHPSGKMQTLLLQYGRRCQNTFVTRNPKIQISDVYVYKV